MAKTTVKTVHVIYKTHLDIGFTDLAANVVDQYMNQFIPKALDLSEQAMDQDGRRDFIWTTGSWLIYEYLRTAAPTDRLRMEQAIQEGRIAWHGLPFTTHTELMDPSLFEFGLSLSNRLDQQFGKRTIAAKMTDVPGHTIAMVPHLAKFGIQYLHLGVNPASKTPNVPAVFRWQASDGSEVIVNYADNYGQALEIDGLEDALVFAHTGDNCGPPSLEDIQSQLESLAAQYPGAVIQASTLDAFAERLMTVRDKLPIIKDEIGDSWIHGVGTDPLKVSQYRELLRLRNQWIEAGTLDMESEAYYRFSERLLLIPEHTWGMDEKKYLPDFEHYSVTDFESARQIDLVQPNVSRKYDYIGAFAMDELDERSSDLFNGGNSSKSYSLFESSWQEQRGYLQQAIDALPVHLQDEAKSALQKLSCFVIHEEREEGASLVAGEWYRLGTFDVRFAADGSMSGLIDLQGKVWADPEHRIGLYRYETFSKANYDRWFEEYLENIRVTHPWSEGDFGKPGMEFALPKPVHQLHSPILQSLQHISSCSEDQVIVRLIMPSNTVKDTGAPKELVLKYIFSKSCDLIDVSLLWKDKKAFRLPEAGWMSIGLVVDNPNHWELGKMGQWISPLFVVKNGNRNMHAVNEGVRYLGTDGHVQITTLDAPLVCPGEPRLLQFDQTFAPLDGGMHFNLHNNVWGTNFPMWVEGDAQFRFTLEWMK